MSHPVPGFARGAKFRVVSIPDPEAEYEEGRRLPYTTVLTDLRRGYFLPGTVLCSHGNYMVVQGEAFKPQRLRVFKPSSRKPLRIEFPA